MGAMGIGNLEIELASYLKKNCERLKKTGIQGELIRLENIVATLNRGYDGQGYYRFDGSSDVLTKVNEGGVISQRFNFTGTSYIVENSGEAEFNIEESISFVKS